MKYISYAAFTNMTKSILIIGDPHFRVDNIEQSTVFTNGVKQACVSLQNDLAAIVIMGDVLHNHEKIHTSALNCALAFIKMCSAIAKTFILVGNHDAINNSIFCTDDHWMNVLKPIGELHSNIVIVDKPQIHLISDKQICFCPYVPDGRLLEALDLHVPKWESVDLVLCHQLLNGAKMGPMIATDVEDWDQTFPMLISGHIHDKQQVQPNLYYCGSSMQHAFGETADKSCCLYNCENKTYSEIFIPGPKPKTILTVDVSECNSVLLTLSSSKDYKVVIKGDKPSLSTIKNSDVFKQIKNHPSVKNVQVKVIQPELVEDRQQDTAPGFYTTLSVICKEKNDVLLTSFIQSLLGLGEDLSESGVVLLNQF